MKENIILGFIVIIGSIAASFLVVQILNKIPPKWLTDYNVEPDASLSMQRIRHEKYIPVLVAVFALSLITLYVQYGGSYLTIIYILVIYVLALIAIADGKYGIIPDQFIIAMVILGFILWIRAGIMWQPLLGSIIGGGVMLLLAVAGAKLFRKDEVLGMGDVKLLAAVGALCGVYGIIVVMLLMSVISGICLLALVLTGKAKLKDTKPLGPYIAVATAIYIIFAPQFGKILTLYLNIS